MDEALLLASRLLLLIAGVGGALAIIVSAARRRIGWLPAIAAALILLILSIPPASPQPEVVTFLLLLPWFVGFPLLAATFPDGRFVPRWSMWIVVASLAVLIVNALVGDAMRDADWWWIFPLTQGTLSVGIVAYRYRRSATTAERESVRWVLLGVLLTFAAFMLLGTEGTIGVGTLGEAKANLAGIPLVLGLIIGAVWPRVWNVDAAFRATLIVLAAGWGLGGIFAAVTVVADALGVSPMDALRWAAFVVAIAAFPVIRVAATLSGWLVYRDRLDADAAVASLAAALEADDTRTVAERVVEVASTAIRSPLVRLEPAMEADAAAFAATIATSLSRGVESEATERFPVAFRGELLATLSVAPRSGESELSARDRAAIGAIARHAAPALDGARALLEARAARSQLIGAQEEERRRLRRELHDDLGPALSGLALSAAALSRRAVAVDESLAASAHELQADIGEAVARSREISHGLRPPVLDDQGLEAAIRSRLGPMSDVRLEVTQVGDLPAAVDLAALRIVQEAVTNVRRHAAASVCSVRIHRETEGLRIEVADDGIGMPRSVAPGLGLRSIRARASELGGRARVSRPAEGGTLVSVWLPIAGAAEAVVP